MCSRTIKLRMTDQILVCSRTDPHGLREGDYLYTGLRISYPLTEEGGQSWAEMTAEEIVESVKKLRRSLLHGAVVR